MNHSSGNDPAEAMRSPQHERKPYQAPSLRVYGSLAAITDSVTFMGSLDGGMVIGMRRTGG